MKTYGGIADCHGIESFLPEEEFMKQFTMFTLRANLNRQRHAVVYVVTLEDADVKIVEGFLKGDKKDAYIKALEFIQKRAHTIGYPDAYKTSYAASWDMIPNPKLDPWR